MVEFDVPEIIHCKDSATGRTQVLRVGIRACQTELEFAGQPDSHLLASGACASVLFPSIWLML